MFLSLLYGTRLEFGFAHFIQCGVLVIDVNGFLAIYSSLPILLSSIFLVERVTSFESCDSFHTHSVLSLQGFASWPSPWLTRWQPPDYSHVIPFLFFSEILLPSSHSHGHFNFLVLPFMIANRVNVSVWNLSLTIYHLESWPLAFWSDGKPHLC